MVNKLGKTCPDKIFDKTCNDKIYHIDAPCKINLHLAIGERRSDGFHSLESLFACVALSDTLKFVLSEKEGECTLSMESELNTAEGSEELILGESIPFEDNLVYKAVTLFRERTGFKNGLKVFLTKRIPLGAGLGGGSSDAASTLLALNSFAKRRASTEELAEMAAILGSDVPFFLDGGLAFVHGRGEHVEPIEMSKNSFLAGLSVVLVKPPFPSNTAAAFRLLDEARERKTEAVKPHETPGFYAASRKLGAIDYLKKDPGTWPFSNDFLPVFLAAGGAESDAYHTILKNLRDSGASFASLSGAGSCCFGIFTSPEMAKKAVKRITIGGNFVRLTFFLANRTNTVVE